MRNRLNDAVAISVAGAMVLGFTGEARANPVVSLDESQVTRTVPMREASRNPLWISQADCAADDVMSFPLYVTDYTGLVLEVWAGSEDCSQMAARAPTTATCWQVSESLLPSTNSIKIAIRAQDIVGRHVPPQTGPGTGTAADCAAPGSTDSPIAVSLYFMFVDPVTMQSGGGYKWSTSFDLAGPDAPTELMSEVNGATAMLTWSQSLSTDVAGYSLFRESFIGDDCTQGTFGEGEPAPALAPLATAMGNKSVSQTINLLGAGPESLTVVAFDSVGNLSTQSNAVCVEMGAAVDPGASESRGCSASPGSPGPGSWLFGLVGSALAAILLRRKKD